MGCAATMDELIQEAKECVATYTDTNGIVRHAPDEYRTQCWEAVNRRQDIIERREALKPDERGNCPTGLVVFKNNGNITCETI